MTAKPREGDRLRGLYSCRGSVVMLGLMDDRYQVAVKRVLRHEFHGIKAALSLMLANRLQHKNVLPYLVSRPVASSPPASIT